MTDKQFFKTKIEEARVEGTEYDDGRASAYEDSEQAVKEALLKIRNTDVPFSWLSGGCDEEYCRNVWRSFIDKSAKEDLGIDLSQQRGVSSEKGEVLAETNLAKTPCPVDNQDSEDKK
jgi:hypothetical protein